MVGPEDPVSWVGVSNAVPDSRCLAGVTHVLVHVCVCVDELARGHGPVVSDGDG